MWFDPVGTLNGVAVEPLPHGAQDGPSRRRQQGRELRGHAWPLRELPRTITSQPLRSVRLAVAGLGYWGPNLVRNLYEMSDVDIVSACDIRPEALAPVALRFPTVRTSRKFEDLLEDESIEGILIATPASTHFELACASLAAGKHVFVEKPLASSSHAASELIALAAQKDLVLMSGHTFLYSPPVNLVRSLIDAGQLETIYAISMSRVNLGIHRTDVSVIWDLGAHDFSILRYWLGEMPTSVAALSRDCTIRDKPDVAFVTLSFPSGTIAQVELSWLAPSKLRRTTIVGSSKMVVYDDTSNEPVRIFDSGVMNRTPQSFGEYRLSYRTGDIISPAIDPVEPLALEMADFCAAIRERITPRSSAQLGLDIVRIIEAAERSASAKGAPIPLPSDHDSAPGPATLAACASPQARSGVRRFDQPSS